MWGMKSVTKARPLSSQVNKLTWKGRCCLGAFGMVFLTIGLGFATFIAFLPMGRMLLALQWQSVPCRVITSEVRAHKGDNNDTYSIEMTYSYTVDGKEYRGDRYDFIPGATSGFDGKQAVVNQHPPGSVAVCFVDPADPANSVFERGLSWELLFGLLPMIFAIVGGGIVYAAIRVARPKPAGAMSGGALSDSAERPEWLPKSTAQEAQANWMPAGFEEALRGFGPNDFQPAGRGAPVTLKAGTTPRTMLIASTIIGLIWNGGISIFLWHIYQAFERGNPEWFMSVFMIPFVLIGLGLIAWWIHSILALFNPRPTLELTPGNLALGSNFEIEWRLSGSTSSVRRLEIFLHGEEKATYRRGTDTHTDTREFCKLPLADVTQQFDIPSGKIEGTIPADSMHSFKSSHNEIVWSIELRGDIDWWPNISASFPLVILPMPVESNR